jgi:cytochrome P450
VAVHHGRDRAGRDGVAGPRAGAGRHRRHQQRAGPAGPLGPGLGAGHHYCLGAQLAQLELRAVAEVLRADHPTARLAVPSQQLRRTDFGGTLGNRIVALPVSLTG